MKARIKDSCHTFLYHFLKLNFILFERLRKIEIELYPLFHFPNACNSQGWAIKMLVRLLRVVQWGKPSMIPPSHIRALVWVSTPLSAPLLSCSLLMCLEKNRWLPKYLRLCYPHERPGLKFLTSGFRPAPSPDTVAILGVNQWKANCSLSLSVLTCLSNTQNKTFAKVCGNVYYERKIHFASK